MHPSSLEPYPDATQSEDLADWPRSTPAMLARASAVLESEQPRREPQRQPLRVVYDADRELSTSTSDLESMRLHCEFINRAEQDPAALSYDEWFGLGTVLHAFGGEGDALFETMSRRDAGRYRAGEPERKLESITGKPRLCKTLGPCFKRAACESLGVRSPAGLPFRLRSVLNQMARDAERKNRRRSR